MLRVAAVEKSFGRGVFTSSAVQAVAPVSFELARGRTLAITGESGSGKSTLAMMLPGLLAPDRGRIYLDGKEITRLPRRELNRIRQKIQLIFQDPFSGFNPVRRLYKSMAEPYEIRGISRSTAGKSIERHLASVDLCPRILDRYPDQVSGGELQRLAIARALSLSPAYLVLDEATAMLDVSTQARVLHLLKSVQVRLNLGLVFISHDLDMAAFMGDDLAVMHRGRFVETGPVSRVMKTPAHAYTRNLIFCFKEFSHV